MQARLLEAMARHRAGGPDDRDAVGALLTQLDHLAGLEAWWLTAEVAACFAEPRWDDLAGRRAASLATHAGAFAETFERAARLASR